MDGVWLPLVTIAVMGVVMGGVVWLASRMRRRRVGASIMGPFDEIWHPAAHRARIEIQVQVQRKAPMPSPDDPPEPGDQ
jgi:hypothetical protein